MENVLFKINSCNLFCRKSDEQEEIPRDDIVFDITDNYVSINPLSNVAYDITNIQIYTPDLKIIFVDGEFTKKYKLVLKKIINKKIIKIIPGSHYKQLENTINQISLEKLHIQRVYAYGKSELLHNYFGLVDRFNNIVGVLLIISNII